MRNFNELRSKMKPEAQARAKARADDLIKEMALADLRRARALTQQQLAKSLCVNQAWISKVERQADMYLSTLRGYVEALGGRLEVSARFDDCVVGLNQFAEVDKTEAAVTIPALLMANATVASKPIEPWISPHGSTRIDEVTIASNAPNKREIRPPMTTSKTTPSSRTSKAA